MCANDSERKKTPSAAWTKAAEAHPLTIHDFIAMPFRMYGLTGLQLFSLDSGDAMTPGAKVRLACATLLLTFNFCTKFLYPFFREFEDTLQMTALTVYLGFASNGVFKVASVWLGRNTLRDIVLEMLAVFPRTAAQRREYRLAPHYAKLRRTLVFLASSHGTVALMFLLFPIAQSLVEYFGKWREDGLFVPRLPYIMVYPYDEHETFWFCFSYTVQFVGGITVSAFFVGSDMMLLTTVYLVNIEFEYLARWIRRMGARRPSPDIEELKRVLEYHSRILDSAKRIDSVFSISILLNYVATTLVTCLIGFLLVAGSEFFYLIKFIGFLTTAVLHIYYMSYFSSNLMELSSDIAVALSEHEWYEADGCYQRLLPLAIARAQRPTYLTAYKFIVVSMESFTSFVTTSYQFFTLIKTRYEEANQL